MEEPKGQPTEKRPWDEIGVTNHGDLILQRGTGEIILVWVLERFHPDEDGVYARPA